jgi:hypothetical protein
MLRCCGWQARTCCGPLGGHSLNRVAALAVYSLRHVAALWVVTVSNMLRSEGKCGSLGGHSSRHVLRFVGQQSRGHMMRPFGRLKPVACCGMLGGCSPWHVACVDVYYLVFVKSPGYCCACVHAVV